MKLILSDKNLNVILPNNTKFIDLSTGALRPPGCCVRRSHPAENRKLRGLFWLLDENPRKVPDTG